jgi:hypothetical protein
MSDESYQSEGGQRPTSNIIDEGVADENSRCDSIGNAAANHPNNVQESTNHNAKLTEMIQANFANATPSTADVTQVLWANTFNGEHMDEASSLPRPQAHLSRTSSMRSSISGEESTTESHWKSTYSILSSTTSCGDESNELDVKTNPLKDSVTMLQRLGNSPSTHELV